MEVIKKRRTQENIDRFLDAGGGLYINALIGETIEITHGGETIKVTLCGKQSNSLFKVGFCGPQSFVVQRDKKKWYEYLSRNNGESK